MTEELWDPNMGHRSHRLFPSGKSLSRLVNQPPVGQVSRHECC